MKRWYVVHTHARAEPKALFHLKRQGFEAYLPQYLKRRRHARCVDWVRASLFPRYLFVALDMDAEHWRPVLSTVGVSYIIRQGDHPAPAPDTLIESIRARENDDGQVVLSDTLGFKKGDTVHILHDAFGEHLGVFECADDNERVVVLLNLLGREVRVRVPAEAVAAYA